MFLRAASICICILVPLSAARSALPPEHQRFLERGAILSDRTITERFGRPIETIEYVSVDLYRLSAGGCTMDVEIANDPDWHPPKFWHGPRHFVVKPGTIVCRPSP